MTEQDRKPRLSRRGLVRGTTAAAALAAAGLPLTSCTTKDRRPRRRPPPDSAPPGTRARECPRQRRSVRRPCRAVGSVNPGNRRQLLAACQVSPARTPSSSRRTSPSTRARPGAAAACHSFPADAERPGDDVTVAFDAHGRGYVCATSSGGGSAVYVWRTDDGGRSFSAPVTVVSGERCDHPWMARVADRHRQSATSTWPGPPVGDKSALGFARSTDGGESFEAPRHPGPGRPVISAAVPRRRAERPGVLACDRMSGRTPPASDRPGRRRLLHRRGQSFGPPVCWGRSRRPSACPARYCRSAARRPPSPPMAVPLRRVHQAPAGRRALRHRGDRIPATAAGPGPRPCPRHRPTA